jgi:hypothetical protein
MDLYSELRKLGSMTSGQCSEVEELIDELNRKEFGWKYPTRNQLPNEGDFCLVATGMKVVRLCYFENNHFKEYNDKGEAIHRFLPTEIFCWKLVDYPTDTQ